MSLYSLSPVYIVSHQWKEQGTSDELEILMLSKLPDAEQWAQAPIVDVGMFWLKREYEWLGWLGGVLLGSRSGPFFPLWTVEHSGPAPDLLPL